MGDTGQFSVQTVLKQYWYKSTYNTGLGVEQQEFQFFRSCNYLLSSLNKPFLLLQSTTIGLSDTDILLEPNLGVSPSIGGGGLIMKLNITMLTLFRY